MDKEELKTNLLSSAHWMRLVFMLLFVALLHVATFVVWVVTALQFLFALFTGHDNVQLRKLGDTLSQYVFQVLQFLSYNTEEKPFPFKDWPTPRQDDAAS